MTQSVITSEADSEFETAVTTAGPILWHLEIFEELDLDDREKP